MKFKHSTASNQANWFKSFELTIFSRVQRVIHCLLIIKWFLLWFICSRSVCRCVNAIDWNQFPVLHQVELCWYPPSQLSGRKKTPSTPLFFLLLLLLPLLQYSNVVKNVNNNQKIRTKTRKIWTPSTIKTSRQRVKKNPTDEKLAKTSRKTHNNANKLPN